MSEAEFITQNARRAFSLAGEERDRAVAEVLSQVEHRITLTLLNVTKGNAPLTQELRQRTFEALLKRLNADKETQWENFPAYCASVAVNIFRKWLKDQKREPIDRADSLDEEFDDGDPVREVESLDNVVLNVESKEGRAQIRMVLMELPLRCRVALLFAYTAHFPFSARESAEILEENPSGFNSAVQECKRKFKKRWIALQGRERGTDGTCSLSSS